MASPRLSVVTTRRLPRAVEARMAELFDLVVPDGDLPLSREQIARALPGADILVPTLGERVDAALIALSDRLKLVANYGAGVDHIDVASARQRGVLVSNTPGALTQDTAEMAFALMLAVVRRMPEGMAAMQANTWAGWAPEAMLGTRLSGRKLGILGMGRIGQAVARRARAFGMEVQYHNRRRLHAGIEEPLDAVWQESLDRMVADVDVLSVNCPHTPATFHLLNARRLKLMKPSAVIVNTSRGEVIDENALTRMLRAGELAGAGLDVFEHGKGVNPRLLALPNVVLTPHMASATHEARAETGERLILNMQTFADGHRPPDLVVPSML